jgi:hypothetical protein
MATRNDIQIAQDLIRFVNIMNDLLDCASYILREIDPQTGEKYQIQIPDLDPPEYRDATLEELKETVKRTGQNILGYWNMIDTFKNKFGAANVRDALLSLGIDAVAINNDLANFDTEAKHLWQNIQAAKTKEELIPFADRIDANVPKLVLVRRSWGLGL